VEGVHVCLQGVMVINLVPKPWSRWLCCVWVISIWFGVLHILLQASKCRRKDFSQGQLFDGGISNVRVGCHWFSSKSVSIIIASYACVKFDFVEMNEQWWLVDCFGNGLKDISLDEVAVEVWVWELFSNLVHWGEDICGYMGVAVNDCGCYSC